ncbi:DinB family protein [Sporosarcina thermotolerans]|uniref:DinB family protein n=1 Tax=Sporosarcina thermotolerans TaxID=633404 RepID=A0AAW9A9T9_9BACL|nr:DinB family protein [Sporosarcina thermotolerans]MDW0117755.1 DinB family protein [Sporosarcina thermotolerans]WHT49157.1 DinB family protein [Sporosarcina thermotolerans]
MFTTVEDFFTLWEHESNSTQKLLDTLTDESLSTEVSPEDRTLGRVAWHIVTALGDMMSRTDLEFEATNHNLPLPESASEIAEAYRTVNEAIIAAIKEQWTDNSLSEMKEMYGQQWSVGTVLGIVMSHQTHHRGQMTVLMRQAGLPVYGVYGPAREEWKAFGAPVPTV